MKKKNDKNIDIIKKEDDTNIKVIAKSQIL